MAAPAARWPGVSAGLCRGKPARCTPGHTTRSLDQRGSHVTQTSARPAVLPYRSLSSSRSWPSPSQVPEASTLRRPGNPLVLVKHSQGRLKPVRPAKPLKPRRDLQVIQVRTIAAAGADQLIHVGVAALDTAVHDADRLAPQDRLAAVTGLAGGQGCRDPLSRDAQPPVAAIAGTRCGDSGRTDSRSATRRRVRGTRTAHLTHRQEVAPATTGVWSSDAVITRR